MKMDSKTNMKKKSNIKGQNKNFETQNKTTQSLKEQKCTFIFLLEKYLFEIYLVK